MVPWKSLPMPCKELPPKLRFSQDVHFRDLPVVKILRCFHTK